jgi:phytoene dehydrogenase-like protein
MQSGSVKRYDAVVIGAGAEGLTASIALARAGLKTLVIERTRQAGGRCRTDEFHPGFRASPFCDEVAPIPPDLIWSLDLARRGVIAAPSLPSLALWPKRASTFAAQSGESAKRLTDHLAECRRLVSARAATDVPVAGPWSLSRLRRLSSPWPCEDWAQGSLATCVDSWVDGESAAAHVMAAALCGRSADPFQMGSALHLLAPGRGGSGVIRGGLGTLTSALSESALAAGVAVSYGLEATELRQSRRRLSGVVLADGTQIATRRVVSTLDVKRTFLSLFKWDELPELLVQRVRAFRMNGATARLLLALDRVPALPPDVLRGPIYLAPDLEAMARAHSAWRKGSLAESLPLTVRVLSTMDPSLAPARASVMTVTIGCVPYRLSEGCWTRERRDQLQARVLGAIESALPGTRARIVGLELITPPDIEEAIGCTDGDLAGGEIAPDQMLGQRPWGRRVRGPRTPLRGLYLAGPSSLLGTLTTCGSGAAAARAAIADRKWSRLA